MVGRAGLEPATSTLSGWRSPTELPSHHMQMYFSKIYFTLEQHPIQIFWQKYLLNIYFPESGEQKDDLLLDK